MIVFCFEREAEVCTGGHLGVIILTMCWVLHALWGLTLQASPDQRDNSDFLLPYNFPAWHVAPYSSSLGYTAAPSGNTELRLWSPLCWGLFCFLQDDMISVVCYSFSAAFAKETVYHRHPHEASWNLSPGGCNLSCCISRKHTAWDFSMGLNILKEVCMCVRTGPHSEVGGCSRNMAELI